MYNGELLEEMIQKNKIDLNGSEYRKKYFERFNELEFPVWQRMKVKDTSAPDYRPYKNQKLLWQQQEGLSVKALLGYQGSYSSDRLEKKYGPSEKHKTLAATFSNAGTVIEVKPDLVVSEPVIIQLELNDENPLILDHHLIHVGERSKVTLVIDYSDVSHKGYQNGLINIVAEAGAEVHVIKIQNMGKASTHISSVLSVIERDALVRFNSIDLGSGVVVTDYSSYMEDENAESKIDSIYIGDGESKLDLAYNIYHNGRRSLSEILVKGALMDSAHKVFRGNLYFAKGAKRSKGAEQEYVILLDEKVRADSIPALMCDEDDVQGEHAASAGQVDASKLFYLMSRGLTEKEAKQLVIMAAFAPVIESIPIDGLKDRINDEVGRRLAKNA